MNRPSSAGGSGYWISTRAWSFPRHRYGQAMFDIASGVVAAYIGSAAPRKCIYRRARTG